MSKPLRVLVVEDSEDDAALLLWQLRRGGYDPTFERVDTSEAMRDALDKKEWDVIIADYTMPQFNGLAALALMKGEGFDLPFIIVSGSIGEDLAVEAMKAGAHDYMMKGNLKRLIPAVERELQEAEVRWKRKKTEEELIRLTHRYELILSSAGEGIFGLDVEGKISFINPSAAGMLRYEVPELIGQPMHTVLRHAKPDGTSCFPGSCPIEAAVEDGSEQILFDEIFYRKDGTTFPVEYVSTPIREKSQIVGAVVVFKDITERRMQIAALEHYALHDSLTDLPNRTLLRDRLQQEILASRREKRPLALLLMDLDRFKDVNDTLGHHNGDLLLQQLGPRLREVVRGTDTIARFGGDEFAVLMPDLNREWAVLAVEKILKALESPFILEGLTLHIEVSIGMALFPDHGEEADLLIQRADVAMYVAKEAVSGCAVYTPEQDQYSPRRLALMGDLRYAIQQGQLFLRYQPKVDLQLKRVIGVEALVRWRHPQYGLISPGEFITMAERTGLIKMLTLWVLEKALRQFHLWYQMGLMISVAVNLSARNLQDPQLPEQVADLCSALQVDPSFLELEITESTIMADPVHSMEVLTCLRKMGVRLSIDDFGTGYSSLGYLKKLPVDQIKIDKSFVREMPKDEDDAAIVRSTIDLAHNLGLKVIAEGVENQETWNRLVALGCDAAQGYYISRPISASELISWLKESPLGIKGDPSRNP